MKKTLSLFILYTFILILGACTQVEGPALDSNGSEPETTQEENSQQEESTVDTNSSETSSENKTTEDINSKETTQEDTTGDTSSNETSQEGPETEEFPSQIEEMIEIEAMEQPITLNLYNYVDAPFLTYVPSDMIAEEASGGEGDAYYFYANYEGQKLEDIYLQVYFFAEHITEEPSIEEGGTLATLLEGMECVPSEQRDYSWAIREYQSPEGSRRAMLGEHSGQYFVTIINSIPLYSEGFYPRVNKIIDHFYWKDTQEYLVTDRNP